MKTVLGLDQGTSGTKAYLMDSSGNRIGFGYQPITRSKPQAGWSELDPMAVARSAQEAITTALRKASCQPQQVAAVGIASQRDTDFIWESRNGTPLAPAITWQDLRTVDMVEGLNEWIQTHQARYYLGYYPGPWCAALHLGWRAKNQAVWQEAVNDGTLCIGMSGAWLIQALGSPNQHLHDYSLIQKTGLWDFRRGQYWQEWVDQLGITSIGLPKPAPTIYDYGRINLCDGDTTAAVPVVAMIGDQQATLFGHGCTSQEQAECTHGTASFVNVNVGHVPPVMEDLNVYYAWSFPAESDPEVLEHTYCLEADTTTSGAAVRWMNEIGILREGETRIDELVSQVSDSHGAIFVPAFTGLNVPYNDHNARATLLGLTLSTTRLHIVRAFLESLGFQIRAILETIQSKTDLEFSQLSVGGGLSRSDAACQIQADLTGIPIHRPGESDTTARGAALFAGMGIGLWSSFSELPPMPVESETFYPQISQKERDARYAHWQVAVEQVRRWGAGVHQQ